MPDADDRVPEEDEGLVEVLRQAYTSVAVPPDLHFRVGSAVSSARAGAGGRKLVGPIRPRVAGMALVSATVVAAIAGGILIAGHLGSARPTAQPTAKSMALWTNEPGLSIISRAAYIPPHTIRVTYRISRRLSHSHQHRPSVRARGLGRRQAPASVPMDLGSSVVMTPSASLDGYRLAQIHCPGGRVQSTGRSGVACFRMGDDFVDVAAGKYRTVPRRTYRAVPPLRNILLILSPAPDFGIAGGRARRPSETGKMAPLPRVLMGPGYNASHLCRGSRRYLCWLVRLHRLPQPVAALPVTPY